MGETLYKYLHNFMIHNNWTDENVPKQSRAIFTTICLLNNIQADTGTGDIMLLNLYGDSAMMTLDISYNEFENYMYALLV